MAAAQIELTTETVLYHRLSDLTALYSGEVERNEHYTTLILGVPLTDFQEIRNAAWIELVRLVRQLTREHGWSSWKLRDNRGFISISEAERLAGDAGSNTPEGQATIWPITTMIRDAQQAVRDLRREGKTGEADSLLRASKTYLRRYFLATTPATMPARRQPDLPPEIVQERAAAWPAARKLVLQQIKSLI